jgi:murein L,D-transpeptidase YcbB/YkuD
MTSATLISRKPYTILILTLCVLMIVFQSCKKKRRWNMNDILFKKTHNKVFKKLDADIYDTVFNKVLDSIGPKLNNYQFIKAYYTAHNDEPGLLEKHLSNDDLKVMVDYFQKAGEHGFNPGIFQADTLDALLHNFYDGKAIKNTNEAYHDLATLELLSANSLINYSNDVQFGIVNPKKIYPRYFMATMEADSTSMLHALDTSNLKTYLDSIQPKDPQYLALQKALVNNDVVPGLSVQESKRLILVNMERLRWKNKPQSEKYVIVNIPDFRLDVINSGHSVLNMKVCVGQGRNMDYSKTLMHFDDTDRVDKPNAHETPILNSNIYMAQVNPVWNIPQSIASKEIVKEEIDDKFYLANKGIDVFKDGKKIDDPEDIDWSAADVSDYDFKQEPGDDNSLGKIKFIFKNKSSVYLHDTPAKSAFYEAMRAVSHGCVRLQQPLQLAHTLFGDGDKYDTISKDMAANNPDPTDLYLPKKVPVYITYVTCWADSTGALQHRGDVYGQDIVLFSNLEKSVAN